MRAISAAFGVMWLCSVLAGGSVWLATVTSSIRSNSAEITDPAVSQGNIPSTSVTNRPRVERSDVESPAVDLMGNEVEDAVADYRIDRGGAIYERHSPETEVPRLASPTS